MTGPCPKCGEESGWTGPLYRHPEYLPCGCGHSVVTNGVLLFTCVTCGYQRSEPTKDAPPPPPPKPAWTFIETQPTPQPWWKFWAGE